MQNTLCLLGFLAVIALASAGTVPAQKSSEKANYVVCKNGKQYDPENCGYYYKCDNNGKTGEPQSCGAFSKFDEESHECQFHWWLFGSVDCSRVKQPNPTPTPTGGTTTTPSPDNGKTTSKTGAASVNTFSMSLGLFFLAALCYLS